MCEACHNKMHPISIHALRVEGDPRMRQLITDHWTISIHALRVEGDQIEYTRKKAETDFYPRPPGGGRRNRRGRLPPRRANFYPRPPGGGRRRCTAHPCACRCISIHALRVEGDGPGLGDIINAFIFLSTPSGWRATNADRMGLTTDEFLSTPSGWRATRCTAHPCACRCISIHALRVEGDRALADIIMDEMQKFLSTPSGWRATAAASTASMSAANFYPRPPGGGRHHRLADLEDIERFLSTPSGWRATWDFRKIKKFLYISIHALRVEGDQLRKVSRHDPRDFYPRPPGGGRPLFSGRSIFTQINFYPRPPGGGRRRGAFAFRRSRYFYPRPPGGGRPKYLRGDPAAFLFLSTPSGWRATHGVSGSLAISSIFLSTPSGWRATFMTLSKSGFFCDFYPRPPGGGRLLLSAR